MVAERLDPGEVLESLSGGVLERLVDPEVVRVAVDVGHRVLERGHLVAQGDEEGVEAVGARLGIVLDERRRVPRRGALDLVVVESRVSLGDEHHGSRVPRRGLLERLVHPRDVRGVAGRVLRRIGIVATGLAVTEVVARTLDIERRVGHATDRPAAILDARRRTVRSEAQRGLLDLLSDAVLAERVWRGKEQLPLLVELKAIVVPGGAVAVDPVVVAGRERGGRSQRVEVAQCLGVDGISALARAALEIAVVGREGEVLAVHVGDQVGDADRRLGRRVREIAPQADRVCLVPAVGSLIAATAIPAVSAAASNAAREGMMNLRMPRSLSTAAPRPVKGL